MDAMSNVRTGAVLIDPGKVEFQRNWKVMVACVAGCGFCMATIATHSIGPFIKPIGQEMGWSRPMVQAALLFGQGLGALGAIIMGMLLERYTARALAIVGLLGTGLGLVLASMSDSLVLFYIGYSIAAVVGAGAGFITWSRAITRSFDKKRGLALAIALSGTGISGVVLPSILVYVIAHYGWRAGYLALAAFPLLLALPLILLLFRPQEDRVDRNNLSASLAGRKVTAVPSPAIFRSYRFWVLLTSIFCIYAAVVGIIPNFIPALTDAGLSAERAAVAQGAFSIAIIVGRLVVGYLADKFWAPAVGALFLTPPAIGCLLLMTEPTFAVAAVAAALIGVAAGAELDLLALLVSRYFPPQVFARTYSFLYAGVAVAGGISPMLFAWGRELSGNYSLSFGITIGLFLVGGPVLLTLGRYPQLRSPAGTSTS
jgi:MFS family permease